MTGATWTLLTAAVVAGALGAAGLVWLVNRLWPVRSDGEKQS